jgi:hypothetical protein
MSKTEHRASLTQKATVPAVASLFDEIQGEPRGLLISEAPLKSPITREQIIISGSVGMLAAMVAICGLLISVPLWSALVQSWPAANECSVIKDASSRQACYTKR